MALNFFINSKLSTLSWDAYDHRLSLEEIRKRYDEIVNVPRESNLIVLILVAMSRNKLNNHLIFLQPSHNEKYQIFRQHLS